MLIVELCLTRFSKPTHLQCPNVFLVKCYGHVEDHYVCRLIISGTVSCLVTRGLFTVPRCKYFVYIQSCKRKSSHVLGTKSEASLELCAYGNLSKVWIVIIWISRISPPELTGPGTWPSSRKRLVDASLQPFSVRFTFVFQLLCTTAFPRRRNAPLYARKLPVLAKVRIRPKTVVCAGIRWKTQSVFPDEETRGVRSHGGRDGEPSMLAALPYESNLH